MVKQQQQIDNVVSPGVCSCCALPAIVGKDGSTHPLKSCSRCKQAWYHGVECQRKDYPRHRKQCKKFQEKHAKAQQQRQQNEPVFRVEKRDGRGNCLVARRDCERGQCLMKKKHSFESLVPPVLLESMRMQRCAVCFGTFQDGMYCQFDGIPHALHHYPVYQCSQECRLQSASWLRREEELVARVCRLAEGSLHVFPTAILLYRIVSAAAGDASVQEQLDELQQHEPQMKMDDEEAHMNAVTSVGQLLLRESGNSSKIEENGGITLDYLAKIVTKIKTNSFSIADGESIALGVGLYPMASNSNHSCSPNALQTFSYGVKGKLPSLRLTLCEKIKANQEICISYIDNDSPREVRQKLLRDAYYFQCGCRRCHTNGDDTDMTIGLRCQSCPTTMLVRNIATAEAQDMYLCSNCGATNFDDAIEFMRDFQCQLGASTRTIANWRSSFKQCKALFVNSSWYYRECGDQFLQALLDEVGMCKVERDQIRLCHEALSMTDDLITSSASHQQSSWRVLRTTLLKYKRAKLLLFVHPDPTMAIGELHDCLTQLLLFYPVEHEIIQGIKASLSQG